MTNDEKKKVKPRYYGPLGKEEIRLIEFHPSECHAKNLQIRCSLRTHSFSKGPLPTYSALSYTWGPDTPWARIRLDNKSSPPGVDDLRAIDVNPNLLHALCDLLSYLEVDCLKRGRSFRHELSQLKLWVDALCLNQDADEEKNIWVPRMDFVYKGAQRVFAWVGPEKSDPDPLQFLVWYAQRPVGTEGPIRPETVASELNDPRRAQELTAIWNLVHRDWFSRVWVIQEVTLAREAILYCGTGSIPWEDATKAFQYFHQIYVGGQSHPLSSNGRIGWDRIGASVNHFIGARDIGIQRQQGKRILPLAMCLDIIRSGQLEATDRRDRVWGLLGLLTPEERKLIPELTHVDYQNIEARWLGEWAKRYSYDFAPEAKKELGISQVVDIASREHFERLIKSHPFVVLMIQVDWCNVCKNTAPLFDKHAEQLAIPSIIIFARLDADASEEVGELAISLGARALPAFCIFKSGAKAALLMGSNPIRLESDLKKLSNEAYELMKTNSL